MYCFEGRWLSAVFSQSFGPCSWWSAMAASAGGRCVLVRGAVTRLSESVFIQAIVLCLLCWQYAIRSLSLNGKRKSEAGRRRNRRCHTTVTWPAPSTAAGQDSTEAGSSVIARCPGCGGRHAPVAASMAPAAAPKPAGPVPPTGRCQ